MEEDTAVGVVVVVDVLYIEEQAIVPFKTQQPPKKGALD